MLAGSMGLLASASLGTRRNEYGGQYGMYEPIHGTAPDITGQGIANPLAAIACVAMLLRSTYGLEKEAQTIENAIELSLNEGLRTPDLYQLGTVRLNTIEMGNAIVERVRIAVSH